MGAAQRNFQRRRWRTERSRPLDFSSPGCGKPYRPSAGIKVSSWGRRASRRRGKKSATPGPSRRNRRAPAPLPPHSSHIPGTELQVWVLCRGTGTCAALGAEVQWRGRGVSHAASNGRPGSPEPALGQGTAVGAQPPAEGTLHLDQVKLRGPHRAGSVPATIDLGNEPPLSVDGETGIGVDRRRVSVQWFSGTILTGLCGAALMGGAVFASLDGETNFPASAERFEAALRNPV